MLSMNLRQIRELRGLKQADLADMLGVDKSTISRAEAMHPSAKLDTYQKCADVLNVTLADLFCDDLSPVKRELLVMIDKVPDESLGAVMQLLKMATSGASTATE